MWYAIVGGICLLVGGYGGYRWGRTIQLEGQAFIDVTKTKAQAVDLAIRK